MLLQQALASGQLAITAEVTPPRGGDPSRTLAAAKGLKGWVHAVNVTDGSRAVMRMSSLAMGRLLLDAGIEPVLQLACRDRNRIALQADLLGAHALGLRNVLCLTGDPVGAGDQPGARPVNELEAVRLLQLVAQLNAGIDPVAGELPDGATALERFVGEIAGPLGIPVLAGVFLLKSAKNAAFINRVVPGANIPQAVIDRLAGAATPAEEGVVIAAEQVASYLELAQGVHLMAIKAEERIPEILRLAGLGPLAGASSIP